MLLLPHKHALHVVCISISVSALERIRPHQHTFGKYSAVASVPMHNHPDRLKVSVAYSPGSMIVSENLVAPTWKDSWSIATSSPSSSDEKRYRQLGTNRRAFATGIELDFGIDYGICVRCHAK